MNNNTSKPQFSADFSQQFWWIYWELSQVLWSENPDRGYKKYELTRERWVGLNKYKDAIFCYPEKVQPLYDECEIKMKECGDLAGVTIQLKSKLTSMYGDEYSRKYNILWELESRVYKKKKWADWGWFDDLRQYDILPIFERFTTDLKLSKSWYVKKVDGEYTTWARGRTIAFFTPYLVGGRPVRIRFSPWSPKFSLDVPDDCACPIAAFKP